MAPASDTWYQLPVACSWGLYKYNTWSWSLPVCLYQGSYSLSAQGSVLPHPDMTPWHSLTPLAAWAGSVFVVSYYNRARMPLLLPATSISINKKIVKLRQWSGKDGKDGQGWARMALKAKGLKALNPCQELTLKLVATTTTTTTHPPPTHKFNYYIEIQPYHN